jgi:hypothetical protein
MIIALAFGTAACTLAAQPAHDNSSQEPHMNIDDEDSSAPIPSTPTPSERAAIIEAVVNIARGADLHQWDVVASSFADPVVLDYGSPELLSRETIIARWLPLLSAFDSTQHAVRDLEVVLVDGRARVRSNFEATHHLKGAEGGEIWTLEGRYEHELVKTDSGWKVARMRMIPVASSGNAGLLAAAQEKAGIPVTPPLTTVERVTFKSGGATLVGWLHRPVNGSGKTAPAVVVTGAWITVKEQMPLRYAKRLVEAGYAALIFDFRGYGESNGMPRSYESPARKTDDILAAADFLRHREDVDGSRIGLLGICASSGYAAAAASRDPQIKSLALVAPWLHDEAIVKEVYGATYETKLAAGLSAKAWHEASGEVRYVLASSSTDTTAAMHGPVEFLDYYLNPNRGMIPQWDNRFAELSWAEWLTFDGIASAPQIHAPVQMVHSESAAIPQGAKLFYEHLATTKDIVWLDERTQFDFYDQEATVSVAAQAVVEHFGKSL